MLARSDVECYQRLVQHCLFLDLFPVNVYLPSVVAGYRCEYRPVSIGYCDFSVDSVVFFGVRVHCAVLQFGYCTHKRVLVKVPEVRAARADIHLFFLHHKLDLFFFTDVELAKLAD